MKRTFVTSDTHGCYLQLHSCLVQAKFDYEVDELIHLGDIVDRGPDSKKVVDLLLQMRNLIKIQGNHDEVWLANMKTGYDGFGGGAGSDKTELSYMIEIQDHDEEGNPVGLAKLKKFYPPAHIKFFEDQILHYVDDQNRFFCHAGYDRMYPIKEQHGSIFRWDRKLPYEMMSVEGDKIKRMRDINEFKRVFIGHTPTINWKKHGKLITTPIYKAQYVNIDTGGCFVQYGGKISLIDITDDDNHILYQA